MTNTRRFVLQNQELTLLPEKAVYVEAHKTLLAADLHLGKSTHFRKAGIPVPAELARADLNTLESVILKYKPDRFIILGDLFHSEVGHDLMLFKKWRKSFSELQIDLIRGNHDILPDEEYTALNIKTHSEQLLFTRFLLKHRLDEKIEIKGNYDYIISAHMHPAVKLVGKGKQSLMLPCFYFGKSYGLLPAFGRFTGKAILQPGANDDVFVIIESDGIKKVIPVK